MDIDFLYDLWESCKAYLHGNIETISASVLTFLLLSLLNAAMATNAKPMKEKNQVSRDSQEGKIDLYALLLYIIVICSLSRSGNFSMR
jgi:hypothetical protein